MRSLLLTLTLILIQSSTTIAQVLSARVNISVHNSTLEDVLNTLQSQHQLAFSYGFDNATDKKLVSIEAKGATLYAVIQEIARQANLDFIMLGNTILFRNRYVTAAPSLQGKLKQDTTTITNHSDNWIETRSPHRLVNGPSPLSKLLPSPIKLRSSSVQLNIPTAAFIIKADHRYSRVGAVLEFNLDAHQYRFRKRDISEQRYHAKTTIGIGGGVFYRLTTKMYIGIGLKWSRKEFTLDYNYQLFDPDDPFPVPNKTKVSYEYIEVPVSFRLLIVNKKNSSVWISSMFAQSAPINKSEATTYLNKTSSESSFFTSHPSSRLCSVSLGLVLNQKVSTWGDVFISPSYLFYSTSLNAEAMKSATRAIRMTAGIHYLFSKNN